MSVRSDSGRDGGQRESVQIADQFALLASILGSPTEYAIVAEDFDRTSLTWNEDARRLYGYEAAEVVGKAKTLILYDSDDVKSRVRSNHLNGSAPERPLDGRTEAGQEKRKSVHCARGARDELRIDPPSARRPRSARFI